MKKTTQTFYDLYGMHGILFEMGDIYMDTQERTYPNADPYFLLPDVTGLKPSLVVHSGAPEVMTGIVEYDGQEDQPYRYGILYTPATVPLGDGRVNIPDGGAEWFSHTPRAGAEVWIAKICENSSAAVKKQRTVNIELTCETVVRRCYQLNVTLDAYERICEGDTSDITQYFEDTLKDWKNINTDVETDYTVLNLDTGVQVVDWR